MTWMEEVAEPTDAQLWAIEAESQELAAKQVLAAAEAELFARRDGAAVAHYIQALLDLVDLHDFGGDLDSPTQPTKAEPNQEPMR